MNKTVVTETRENSADSFPRTVTGLQSLKERKSVE